MLFFFFPAYNYIIYQRHGLPEPTQNHPSSIFAFFPLLFLSLLFFHSGPRLSPPRELAPDHHPLTIESEKKATLRIFYLLSYPTYPTLFSAAANGNYLRPHGISE